ncbi:unnamed protein product [Porites lobata]|uniref:Uncharacterized protein n=1 Tax=Porites lobata TaxID=104759 RepID=A0ABN8P2A9_9CNID|nr:unnamed protein product [Porites lobata]
MECPWAQQKSIMATKSKRSYRWHPKIIRLCIDLYCKNPHVLDPLGNLSFFQATALTDSISTK